MRTLGQAVILVVTLMCVAIVRAEEPSTVPELAAARREHRQAIREMRNEIARFYDATDAGDTKTAGESLTKIQQSWGNLPERLKTAIEKHHPGTADRVKELPAELTDAQAEAKAAAEEKRSADAKVSTSAKTVTETKTTGDDSKTTTEHTTITHADGDRHRETVIDKANGAVIDQTADRVRDGNTLTRDETTTGPKGTVTSKDTWTKDGNTITHEGETTNGAGKVLQTREGTITKDGDTVTRDSTRTDANGKVVKVDSTLDRGESYTRDKTITEPNGKIITKDTDITKDGNTVTRDHTVTNSNGKSIDSHDTWTKNGNTVAHEGDTTNQAGKVLQSREGTRVKDGDTMTRDATRANANGSGTQVREQATHEGNTAAHDHTATHKPAAAREATAYRDEADLFGNRHRTKAAHGKGGRHK